MYYDVNNWRNNCIHYGHNRRQIVSVKITMTIKDALALAIAALDNEAEENYEGEEREDPEIAAWIEKRYTARSLLERQLKNLEAE
jgi:hypothetical protein